MRRIFLDAGLNTSNVDTESLQADLDEVKLQLRTLNAELDAKNKDIAKLRNTQKSAKSTIMGLESQLQLFRVQLQNAKSEYAAQKTELDRLRVVEKELNEQLQVSNKLDYIKHIIDSEAKEIEEILKQQQDVKTLATLVVMNKKWALLSIEDFPFWSDFQHFYSFQGASESKEKQRWGVESPKSVQWRKFEIKETTQVSRCNHVTTSVNRVSYSKVLKAACSKDCRGL